MAVCYMGNWWPEGGSVPAQGTLHCLLGTTRLISHLQQPAFIVTFLKNNKIWGFLSSYLSLQRKSNHLSQRITKRCRHILVDQWAPSYMSPNAGGGGEVRGLSQWVQLYTGAQINFGDLTQYLTYDSSTRASGLRSYDLPYANRALCALRTHRLL